MKSFKSLGKKIGIIRFFCFAILMMLLLSLNEAYAAECDNNDETCWQRVLAATKASKVNFVCQLVSQGLVHVPPKDAYTVTLAQAESSCYGKAQFPIAGVNREVCLRYDGETDKMNRLRWSCILKEDSDDCSEYNVLAAETTMRTRGDEYDTEVCSKGRLASGRCYSGTRIFYACICDNEFNNASDAISGNEQYLDGRIHQLKEERAARALRAALKDRTNILRKRLKDARKNACRKNMKTWLGYCGQYIDETMAQAKLRSDCDSKENVACDHYWSSLEDVSLESRIAMAKHYAASESAMDAAAVAQTGRNKAVSDFDESITKLTIGGEQRVVAASPAQVIIPQRVVRAEEALQQVKSLPPLQQSMTAKSEPVAIERSTQITSANILFKDLGKSVAGDIRIIMATPDLTTFPPHFEATQEHLAAVRVCKTNKLTSYGCSEYEDETGDEALLRWKCCGEGKTCPALEPGAKPEDATCQSYAAVFDKIPMIIRIMDNKAKRNALASQGSSVEAEKERIEQLRTLGLLKKTELESKVSLRLAELEREETAKELAMTRLREIRQCLEPSLYSETKCGRFADETNSDEAANRLTCERLKKVNPDNAFCKEHKRLFETKNIALRVRENEMEAVKRGVLLSPVAAIPDRRVKPGARVKLETPMCLLSNYEKETKRCLQYTHESTEEAAARLKCEAAQNFNANIGGGAESTVKQLCEALAWDTDPANMMIVPVFGLSTEPSRELHSSPSVAEILAKYGKLEALEVGRYRLDGAECKESIGSVCKLYGYETEIPDAAKNRIRCEVAQTLGSANAAEACKSHNIEVIHPKGMLYVADMEEAKRERERVSALLEAAKSHELTNEVLALAEKIHEYDKAAVVAEAERLRLVEEESKRAERSARTETILEKAIVAMIELNGQVFQQLVDNNHRRDEQFAQLIGILKSSGSERAPSLADNRPKDSDTGASINKVLVEDIECVEKGETICNRFAHEKNIDEILQRLACMKTNPTTEDEKSCAAYPYDYESIRLWQKRFARTSAAGKSESVEEKDKLESALATIPLISLEGNAAAGGGIRTINFKPQYSDKGDRPCTKKGLFNYCRRFEDENEVQADLRSVCLHGEPNSGNEHDDYWKDKEVREKACMDYNAAMGNNYITVPGRELAHRGKVVVGTTAAETNAKTSKGVIINGRRCLEPSSIADKRCDLWADQVLRQD